MIKRRLKKFLKNSPIVFNLLARLINWYVRFVYATTKWHIIKAGDNKFDILSKDKTIFAIWHNQLIFALKPFPNDNNIASLISSHSDGKLIAQVVKLSGYQVIEGSTNKNPTIAIKHILDRLGKNGRIIITPDGPRGPKYQVNSVIGKIAHKYGASIVPISCAASHFFTLNSWDLMMIPKPFGKAVILIGPEINLSSDYKQNDLLLTESLNNLSKEARASLEKY